MDNIFEKISKGLIFQFGLRAQGHMPLIESKLTEVWVAIGKEIGWDPETARRFYDRETKPLEHQPIEALSRIEAALADAAERAESMNDHDDAEKYRSALLDVAVLHTDENIKTIKRLQERLALLGVSQQKNGRCVKCNGSDHYGESCPYYND